MTIATVPLTDTFDQWRIKFNSASTIINAQLDSSVLATLTTVATSTLVAAINELNAGKLDNTGPQTFSSPTTFDDDIIMGAGAEILLDNGLVTAPALTFVTDPDTGLYLNAAGDMRMGVGSTDVLQFEPALLTVHQDMAFAAGVSTLTIPTGMNIQLVGSFTIKDSLSNTIFDETGASVVLGEDSITAFEIAPLTVTAAEIANTTITDGKMAANTLTAASIANATITATQIANATITATQIASSTITGGNIANTTVANANIVNNTIENGKLNIREATAQLAVTGARTITYSNGDWFHIQPSGNISIAFSGFPASAVSGVVLEAENFGAHTITWPVGTFFSGGTAPTLTAVGTDLLSIMRDSGGAYFVQVIAKNYIAI